MLATMTLRAPPAIQTPPSMPVPDRHAERVADDWLRFLHRDQARLWANAGKSLDRDKMINPVSQARAVERFKRAAGELVLDIDLQPGKKGRYQLMFATWVLWDLTKDERADPGQPFPINARPAVMVGFSNGTRIDRRITGHPAFAGERTISPAEYDDWNAGMPLIISRHACIRAAQRAEVRTVGDMVALLRSIWLATKDLMTRCPTFLKPPDGQWALPLGKGADAPVAILQPDRSTVGLPTLVCTTILSADMIVQGHGINPVGNPYSPLNHR